MPTEMTPDGDPLSFPYPQSPRVPFSPTLEHHTSPSPFQPTGFLTSPGPHSRFPLSVSTSRHSGVVVMTIKSYPFDKVKGLIVLRLQARTSETRPVRNRG